MKIRIYDLVMLSILLYFCTLTFQVFGQTYTSQAAILSSGGGESSGAIYSNFSVIGETFVNEGISGGNCEIENGFIYMETVVDCAPSWSVNVASYTYQGNITATVYIDGLQTGSPNDKLAAFYNGECRGVVDAWLNPISGEYNFLLAIYSNAASGETMTFKFFDESSCEVVDLMESVAFAPDIVVGTIIDPLVLHNESSISSELDLTVFFEGPLSGSTMTTYLNSAFHFTPNAQPFNTIPWNYAGTETVASFPSSVVDWVLIELRDAANVESASSGTVLLRQAALLLNDGSIRGLDGSSNLSFNATLTQNLFVLVHHRNHLSVISATPVVESGGIYTYNFSDAPNKAYGGEDAQKEHNGIWCMMAGDANADGQIDNVDKNDFWEQQENSPPGYYKADFTFDSFVNSPDLDKWESNSGKGTQVPD